MRAYFTTNVPTTRAIFANGFTDLYEEFGMRGVYFSESPLGINDGFEGDVTLCLDVPDEVFKKYDITDSAMACNIALIPAEVLNRIGRPKVYDHEFAGCSRRELVQSARMWEEREIV